MWPELDSVVTVEITDVNEVGLHVTLPDFDNREGCICLTEISRRFKVDRARLRKMIGKITQAKVLRMDKERGYMDLSIRRMDVNTGVPK